MQFLMRLQIVWCVLVMFIFCEQVAYRVILGFLLKDALYTEYALHRGKNKKKKHEEKRFLHDWQRISCVLNTNESIFEIICFEEML